MSDENKEREQTRREYATAALHAYIVTAVVVVLLFIVDLFRNDWIYEAEAIARGHAIYKHDHRPHRVFVWKEPVQGLETGNTKE